jgi:hypothetical protein
MTYTEVLAAPRSRTKANTNKDVNNAPLRRILFISSSKNESNATNNYKEPILVQSVWRCSDIEKQIVKKWREAATPRFIQEWNIVNCFYIRQIMLESQENTELLRKINNFRQNGNSAYNPDQK